jgi:hypothetical protein
MQGRSGGSGRTLLEKAGKDGEAALAAYKH